MTDRFQVATKGLEGFSNEHRSLYEQELAIHYEKYKGEMNKNAPLFSKALTAMWGLYQTEKSSNGFSYFNEIKIYNDMQCLYQYYKYASTAKAAVILNLSHKEETAKFSVMIDAYLEGKNSAWRNVGRMLLGIGVALILAALASVAVSCTAVAALPLVVMTPFIDAAVTGGVGLLFASTGLAMSLYHRPTKPARLLGEIRDKNIVGLFTPNQSS